MRLVSLLLVVTIVASLVPTATAFRIDSMISKFIGKHLPDYTYSVPGKLLLEPPPSLSSIGANSFFFYVHRHHAPTQAFPTTLPSFIIGSGYILKVCQVIPCA